MWIPGHAGVVGNELADEEAKKGSDMNQKEAKIDKETRKCMIRRTITNTEISHEYTRKAYGTTRNMMEEDSMERTRMIQLRRFRSGHHPLLRKYQVMIGAETETKCRLCGEGEETTEHLWCECHKVQAIRISRGMMWKGTLEEMMREPATAEALLGEILRRLC